MFEVNIVDANGAVVLNVRLAAQRSGSKEVIKAFSKTTGIYTKKSRRVIPFHFVKEELVSAVRDSRAADMVPVLEKLDGDTHFIGSDYL